MTQLNLFTPEPAIRGENSGGGKDVFYCRRRMVWTVDPAELTLSDDEIKARRAREVADFDAVFGPPEAWK